MTRTPTRCEWCGDDPLYVRYHDVEWGVPVHDDRKLFELVVLEGAQAGLSWITILRKREAYREAFGGFDPEKVARFTKRDVAKLLRNPGIVRNRAKIEAAITNAKAWLSIRDQMDSFASYQWQFVEGQPIQNRFRRSKEIPARTRESEAMAKDMKRRGFRFFGPVIAYAHMQAAGMVNDHLVDCYRHRELIGG